MGQETLQNKWILKGVLGQTQFVGMGVNILPIGHTDRVHIGIVKMSS